MVSRTVNGKFAFIGKVSVPATKTQQAASKIVK